MEWDTDADETDRTEDDIDFFTSDDKNEKPSGTSNIPWSSVAKSIKKSSFIFGMSLDFAKDWQNICDSAIMLIL